MYQYIYVLFQSRTVIHVVLLYGIFEPSSVPGVYNQRPSGTMHDMSPEKGLEATAAKNPLLKNLEVIDLKDLAEYLLASFYFAQQNPTLQNSLFKMIADMQPGL